MVATACSLARKLTLDPPDLVVDIGIAGSFRSKLAVGDVVQVASDLLVEMGAEDGERFLPADELGLVGNEQVAFFSEVELKGLRPVNGITVNRVHGNADSIRRTVEQFNPDVESMEGAAVAFSCRQFGIPWVQIRAISNRVEARNRETWDIPLALQNLNNAVRRSLKQLRDAT